MDLRHIVSIPIIDFNIISFLKTIQQCKTLIQEELKMN
jgi:hypothetical protein